MATRIRVWDLPLRVFHWLLALTILGAMVSGQLGGNLVIWHGRLGILAAGLVGFRLAWGVVGSTHARFSQFLRGPGAILAYLRGEWQGIGHNPLGALSVLALLGVVALQSLGGLFSNDDIAFQGPFYALVSKDTSDWLTGLHRQGFWAVLGLVLLHLGAVAFYTHVRKEKLVRAMITGDKEVTDPTGLESTHKATPLALIIAVGVGLACAWAASGAWIPPPPPPPVQVPEW
ncbi:cytochrome b/b6 domain-containing protein [Zoogloea sp.]|uniref:cytochrome b/b6 domain-containing protein n=1 Tax=Zoogloea sp. TaxID=49181 RepID=UPI00261D727F|nr:cytochrome b/b6 domain-containing protein [Zoogloea sp.]MDD3354328.1 cytochrome b/b6 domain-containing protein [Zoogloea sp.]